MRVIGGCLKRKKLLSVSGMEVRPTADRLRESIFNIISCHIKDSIILDLFAGTGAFGIEALSRSAGEAFFIDNNINSIKVISANIYACNLSNRASLITWDILKNLNCLKKLLKSFNLVFMDPPYNKNFIIPALTNLHLSGSVGKEALIVIEHSILEPIIISNDSFYEITDERKYGKSLVSFLRHR